MSEKSVAIGMGLRTQVDNFQIMQIERLGRAYKRLFETMEAIASWAPPGKKCHAMAAEAIEQARKELDAK